MKIVNAFPYYNEKELLALRYHTLKDVVDLFIVTVGTRDHRGNPFSSSIVDDINELGLPMKKFKVIYVTLPSKEEEPNDWVRENAQRDYASHFYNEGDTMFATDADEIINPDFVKYYASVANSNPKSILRIPMVHLNGRADFQVVDENGNSRKWTAAFVCLKRHTNRCTLSEIREAQTFGHSIDFDSIYCTDNGVILDAGWHFSWMGDKNRLLKKVNSIVEGKDFDEKNVSHFCPKTNGTDPLGRLDHRLRYYHWNLLPKAIFEHKMIKDFLLPGSQLDHFYFDDAMGENWFTFPNLYRSMVEKFPSGSRFVEVGVWKGKSAAFMCVEIRNSNKIIDFTCVDHWNGSIEHQEKNAHELPDLYDIYTENMTPVKGLYRDLKIPSLQAAATFEDESLHFVFIDASHEYDDVVADIKAWLPKMKKGGVIAGHDCYPNNPYFGGVYRAVCDTLGEGNFKVSEDCWIYEVK